MALTAVPCQAIGLTQLTIQDLIETVTLTNYSSDDALLSHRADKFKARIPREGRSVEGILVAGSVPQVHRIGSMTINSMEYGVVT